MRHALIFLSSVMVLLAAVSCSSEFPDKGLGGEVTGHLSYQGDALSSVREPMVGVFLFIHWPPKGPPHGARLFEVRDFPPEGLAYNIPLLQPFKYHVVAEVLDMAETAGDIIAAGGYPNFCSFPLETIEVEMDKTRSGVDVTLYDNGGNKDPCAASGNGGELPDPDKAGLRVKVLPPDGFTVGTGDRLMLVLFFSWPVTGPPVFFKIREEKDLAFPADFSAGNVPPGSWPTAVCLDKGGDSQACEGPGDILLPYDDGKAVTYTAGKTISLTFDLQQKTVTMDQ